jgi:homoserine O-acetyltransferase
VKGRPFRLEGGGVLHHVEAAYETWGQLDPDASNAVLVCHALTGDSHAAGRAAPGHPAPGWWADVIGPGLGIDTDRWFVVCVNVLGGCQGTTGPATVDPDTGRPYGSTFPVVTIRDIVRVQAMVGDELGIDRWHAVVGGSMGGMQALEWPIMFPHRVASVVIIATAASASAQQIAWSMVGRRAVLLDPGFAGGDYYDRPPGEGPHRGLALARQIAQIHYRSDQAFSERFGRTMLGQDDAEGFTLEQRFDVEGYLDYHGDKLVRRFDANSYLRLNKAMDLHDVGRGRGGVGPALARVQCPAMVMSIESDILYPPHQQVELWEGLRAGGTRAGFYEIRSIDGHDGFLIETKQIAPILAAFLDGADDHLT